MTESQRKRASRVSPEGEFSTVFFFLSFFSSYIIIEMFCC